MSIKNNQSIVIGICGVTCGGKSTLANDLQKHFSNSKVISQDTYFYPGDSPKHVKVKNLEHVNYDILSSLDMERMLQEIEKLLQKKNVETTNHVNGQQTTSQNETQSSDDITWAQNKSILIIEGFCILNYPPIAQLCDLKFEIVLTKEECMRRRSLRVYDPPDIPGYFELCVWPEYLKNREELAGHHDIIRLHGTKSDLLDIVLGHLNSKYSSK